MATEAYGIASVNRKPISILLKYLYVVVVVVIVVVVVVAPLPSPPLSLLICLVFLFSSSLLIYLSFYSCVCLFICFIPI